MTSVKPSAMMFANVSGCAQTAVVRPKRSKPKPEPAGKSAKRTKKKPAKVARRGAKRG